MPIEAPEVGISRINTQLLTLTEHARMQGIIPVKIDELPEPEEAVEQLSPNLTPSGFWNHHIGGGIAASSTMPPHWIDEMKPVIDSSQRKVHELATRWSIHPRSTSDSLNQATTQAFLTALVATRWSENNGFLQTLAGLVFRTGDLYAQRENIRLIGSP